MSPGSASAGTADELVVAILRDALRLTDWAVRQIDASDIAA